MANQLLSNLVAAHAPNPRLSICTDSDQELIIACEVAIPHPTRMATEHSFFLVLFGHDDLAW